jgi:CRP/FNR family transcriptional regulator
MSLDKTKIWYLKNLDVFSHLPTADHEMIEKVANMRTVAKGERLYLQGSADKNIYILKKGAVKIVKQTPHGKDIIVDIVQSGTIFGEITSIDPKERDESAEMIEDGLICTFDREKFQELMQSVPGLSIKITKMIHFRFRKIENRLLDLLHSSVEQRLAKTLVNLMEEFAVPHENGYLVKVKLTHSDYADLIASTRETVTATFNKLKKMGIIDFDNKYVVIKSEDKLKNICW